MIKSSFTNPLSVIIGLSILASTAHADIVVVPGDSIQDAIDAAANNPGADTILITAGEYVEALEIEDPSPLTIQGLGLVTIMAPEPEGEEPEDIISIEGGHVTLENLHLTLGDDAINADDMKVLTIIRVHASGNEDEGLQVDDSGTVTIVDSIFENNGGDGIGVESLGSLLVIRSVASQNSDGIDMEDVSQTEIRDSVFNGNEDEGIEGDETGVVLVTGTVCQFNEGDGIDLDDAYQIVLVNVESSNNAKNGFQSIAEVFDTKQITVINSRLIDNGAFAIQVQEEDGTVAKVTLSSLDATGNGDGALDIVISGVVSQAKVVN